MSLAMIFYNFRRCRAVSTRALLRLGYPVPTSRLVLSCLAAATGALLAPPLTDLWRPQTRAEAMLAVDGAALSATAFTTLSQRVRSQPFLEGVIGDLRMRPDSEWTSDGTTALDIAKDLIIGGETTVADREAALRKRLAGSISLGSDTAGETLTVSVAGDDAVAALSLANTVAARLSAEAAVSGIGVHNGGADELRLAAEEAEAALTAFTADIGPQRLAALRQGEREARALADEIASREARLAGIAEKLRLVADMSVADVLTQHLPDSLEFTALDYHRQRHVEAKLLLEQLSIQLGPRHPRLLSARGAADAASKDIEIAVAKLGAELRQQQQAASTQIGEMKARQAAGVKEPDGSLERLNALEDGTLVARQAYEKALQDGPANGTQEPLSLTLLSEPALVQAEAHKWSTASIMGLGALIGLSIPLAASLWRTRWRDDEEAELDLAVWPDRLEPLSEFSPPSLETGASSFQALPHPSAEPTVAYEEQEHAAADGLFSEKIREILYGNAIPADQHQPLPPLIAAALAGEASPDTAHSGGQRPSPPTIQADNDRFEWEQEVWELQRQLAALRGRVEKNTSGRS